MSIIQLQTVETTPQETPTAEPVVKQTKTVVKVEGPISMQVSEMLQKAFARPSDIELATEGVATVTKSTYAMDESDAEDPNAQTSVNKDVYVYTQNNRVMSPELAAEAARKCFRENASEGAIIYMPGDAGLPPNTDDLIVKAGQVGAEVVFTESALKQAILRKVNRRHANTR